MQAVHERDGVEGVPELVPARMLNELAYCPRLFYLEWADGEWADSADTVEGRFVHRRVDQEGGRAPEPADCPPDEAEEAFSFSARALLLSASGEGIIARMDLVEGDGERGEVLPVDYKRGRKPDVPGGAWEPERVQLCAQGLVLRENGYRAERGVLYFAQSKQRVEVSFDAGLVARTRELVREARRLAAEPVAPPPLRHSTKCPRCSLAGICLPDEVTALDEATQRRRDEAGAEGETPAVRRICPPRPERLPLYVQAQGHRVSLHGDVLQVKGRDGGGTEARLRSTSQVVLMGYVQVTTQALTALLRAEIPVCFFSYGGWFHGMARGLEHKNVLLRQEQFAAAADPSRALAIARRLVVSKIRNARTMLRRNHPRPTAETLRQLRNLARNAARASAADKLLGVEGSAARLYFADFAGMLKPRPGEPKGQADAGGMSFGLEGRNRRPPRDPVNAMLSFAYAMLAKDCTVTLSAVGFDPYLGFLHRPRYGRPALALDLMEEFRPIVADSVVLTAVNTGVVQPRHFVRRAGAVALSTTGRRAFLQAYERRMDEMVTHPLFGYRVSYRRILSIQARLLARYLRGEIDEVPSFTTR